VCNGLLQQLLQQQQQQAGNLPAQRLDFQQWFL
jgi:hypothetical protein